MQTNSRLYVTDWIRRFDNRNDALKVRTSDESLNACRSLNRMVARVVVLVVWLYAAMDDFRSSILGKINLPPCHRHKGSLNKLKNVTERNLLRLAENCLFKSSCRNTEADKLLNITGGDLEL